MLDDIIEQRIVDLAVAAVPDQQLVEEGFFWPLGTRQEVIDACAFGKSGSYADARVERVVHDFWRDAQ